MKMPKMPEAPEGFVTVEVKLGVRGDDFTEIKSGLSEGQEIYQKEISYSGGGMMFGFGGMGMGGGRNSGSGMPSGMSSGGQRPNGGGQSYGGPK